MSGSGEALGDPASHASTGWLLTLFWIGAYALSLWAIGHILRQRKEPMAMLSWILGILLLPAAGVLLYYLIGERRVRRRARRRRRRRQYIARAIASAARQGPREGDTASEAVTASPHLTESLKQLAAISTKLGSFPLTSGNKVQLFTSARETYDQLLEAIDQARDHIHIEYYIFRPDETGRLIRDRLRARAEQGVEVRLLLDGVGSWGTGRGFFRPLLEAGGRLATFLPAIPLRRPWHINCRNHRKILVVDGEVAFTGSQNIGDEYRGRRRHMGPWKDTHLRLEGPAAQQLQEIFVEDWYFACREDLTASRYLKRLEPKGSSLVQIVASGPDQEEGIWSQIFFLALSLAHKSIRIGTPYFVPDPGLIMSLQNAAYRGIKVEILIPAMTDSRLVLWAGRSYYQELARAGVEIYEFDHGMLHSKTVSIDDHWSLVGSANMDARSFLLNFEVTASIFDRHIAQELHLDFKSTRAQSRLIEFLDDSPGPLFPSLLAGAARLFTPLL